MRFRTVTLFVLCIAVLSGGYYLTKASEPPREASIIKAFTAHRAAFEELRGMLLADEKLARVAEWGVETTDSPIAEIPPKGTFPLERFQQYLSLLKTADAHVAFRRAGARPEVCVLVWGAGFAGDTRHVAICSIDQVPSNLVNSLDAFYSSPKPRQPVYRHIDGNWYIWADW